MKYVLFWLISLSKIILRFNYIIITLDAWCMKFVHSGEGGWSLSPACALLLSSSPGGMSDWLFFKPMKSTMEEMMMAWTKLVAVG